MFFTTHDDTGRRRPPGGRRRRSGPILAGTAFGLVGVLFAASAASAAGLDTYPTDPAEAEASILDMSLGGADLFGLAQSHAGSIQNPGPNTEAFSGALGGTEIVDFGAGYQIPLDQFISFGQLGVLQSQSTATDAKNAEGISGIAGADGGLTLDGTDADFGEAQINLLSIPGASAAAPAIDKAQLSFGLGGAWVKAVDGVLQDPDGGVTGYGQYRAGSAKLVLHSPVIEQAAAGLSDAAGTLESSATDTINSMLNLTSLASLVPGTTLKATVTSSIKQDVLDAVMLAPITTKDGYASIDLGAGTVTIDLARLGSNDPSPNHPDGVIPNRPVGINNQAPNTELIDSDTYPFIAGDIHEAIETVIQVASDAALQSMQSVAVHVDATVPIIGSGKFGVNLAGQVIEPCTGSACAILAPVISATQLAMSPINAVLSDGGSPIFAAFTTLKTDTVTAPVRAAVEPFLQAIAGNLFSIQLNHQSLTTCTATDGSTKTSGAEVSALSFGVGGGTARLGIGNAGARVDACGLAAAPVVTPSSPTPAGGCTTITSTGWAPNTAITFQLTDANGAPVGSPLTVTSDATGAIPAGTCLTVPAGTAPGAYTVKGTDPSGATGSGPVTVYDPSLTAQSPVAPGDCSALTSGGWIPGTPVTFQLTDAAGTAVDSPVTITPDANGTIPAGTCLTIPTGTAPGDYTVKGTDPNGAERTAPVTVGTSAAVPALSAQSPVPAGGTTTVTGTNWKPNAPVSLQLTDPSGNPVGSPVSATTDATGALPAGTTVPVPANAPAGAYTVKGTDPASGDTAAADVTVYAPTLSASSPTEAGQCTTLTSTGWTPNDTVTFQLTDASGAAIGSPLTVTTDATGAVPAGTCLTVPAGTTPGDDTVKGTDPQGADVTSPLTVVAATAPVLTASSPVPAGGTTDVTSGGWAPNAQVTLQASDATGTPIGTPVTVTAGADGTIPAGTTLSIPAGTAAGDYTITGTEPGGAAATDTITVYQPSIQATSPVPAGGTTTVTSTGWLPNAQVALQLKDVSGAPAGAPVTAMADGSGAIPTGTTVAIPASAQAGDVFTVAGTDLNGATVSADVTVYAPALSGGPAAPAGSCYAVAGSGWAPGSTVTLQLTDPSGAPLGAPVTVTADADGALPAGTCVTIPAGTAPGGDTVVGTDDNGAKAELPVSVYAPAITASSPVPAGGTTDVTGAGWLPSSPVVLQLKDSTGAAVGAPVTVTTDLLGAFPAGTVLTTPAGAADGTAFTASATDANGADVSAPVLVYAPTIATTSPVPAGGTTTVTGGGWKPNDAVTLQLKDPSGAPVGAPVTVTSLADGSLPAGTTVAIPADAAPGDFTVAGTDAGGASAQAPVAVVTATGPILNLTGPIPAGMATTVTGGGWKAGAAVALQLTDPAGAPVGAPVTATAAADGTLPSGTTVPVPADATAGRYTVAGTDAASGDTAQNTVDVYSPVLTATTPIPAGGETAVTSSGWLPSTSVRLQLADPAGAPVGTAVTVTTGADGAVPAGTVLAVPAVSAPGAYTVTGTDANGAKASAPVEVTAAIAAGIDATGPVPAGGQTTVTGAGWTPGDSVGLQLVDPAGQHVGAPVTVTAAADGTLPAGTTLPIPDDAAAGMFSVTATDPATGDTDTATFAVYHPTLAATGPVHPGGSTTVSGDGWQPLTAVTLQLTDSAGNPAGAAVTVTTDALGAIPAGTTVAVPADAVPGDFTVVGADAAGAEVAAPLAVSAGATSCTADPAVTIQPSSVHAGDTITVTGTGFAAGSTATVTIADASGAALGQPLHVAVGSDCGFTVTMTVDKAAAPGTHTVTATDGDGNTGRGTFQVAATGAGTGTGNGSGSGTGSLPQTGGEVGPFLSIAILLLLAGAVLTVIRRRTAGADKR
ncbi:LPXTG cell wall anchor domain-containing protein [Microbacterium sp. 22242]|uniref:LPXTG cell wall anchor domain-containing protein n=1 Tax=Microbacterium sp. 22242 TaxID=3453896 RepID=UPI003F834944